MLAVTSLAGRAGLRLIGAADLLNADVPARAIEALPPRAAARQLARRQLRSAGPGRAS